MESEKCGPLSIYIHVPFCARKCAYCDFLSHVPGPGEVADYFDCLLAEIRSWSGLIGSRRIRSIFFGGGTPSYVPAEYIAAVMDEIRSQCIPSGKALTGGCRIIDPSAEITLEANPGTFGEEKLRQWREAGINRLSIGLQSADDGELARLGRIHDWKTFEENYRLARACGYDNINVDLMSALTGQTVDSWRRTLEKVLSLRPEHISAYSLIIEEGTPFYELYSRSESGSDIGSASSVDLTSISIPATTDSEDLHQSVAPLPSEEDERLMYHFTKMMLKEHGYERYEISNYSLPGYESRHNTAYWTGGDYLGIGMGAASYIEGRRFRAPADSDGYREYASSQKKISDYDKQTKNEAMEEFMFLGLRMTEGISVDDFNRFFASAKDDDLFSRLYGDVVDRYIDMGLLENAGRRIKLTDKGIDVSNVVLADFLLGEASE